MSNLGLINTKGELMTRMDYYSVGTFSDGLAIAETVRGGTLGFVDTTGKMVITLEKHVMPGSGFVNGLVVLRNEKTGHSAVINTSGDIVIPYGAFDALGYRVSEGLCPAAVGKTRWDRKWGFTNMKREFVIQPQYKWVDAMGFSEDRAAIGDGEDKNGFIDSHNQAVIPQVYFYAKEFAEGLAGVRATREALEGVIDTTGKQVIPPQFTSFSKFSEGLAVVSYDSTPTYGYINKDGHCVIKPTFNCAEDFADGLAAVVANDRLGFINISGEFVIPPRFSKYGGGRRFHSGVCAVKFAD